MTHPLPCSRPRALLALWIALGLPLASAQQTNRSSTVRSSSSSSFSGSSGGAFAFGGGGVIDAEELMRQVQQAAEQALEGAPLGMSSGAVGGAMPAPANPAPLLVHVRPLGASAQEHWQEDLAVLDRLLQEELAKLEGRSAGQALGVRLRFSTRTGVSPQWIEDFGVLLQGEVRFPLAASPDRGRTSANPAPTTSAWERARVEVRSANGVQVTTHTQFSGKEEPFDPQRLATLDRAITAVLSEARNLRELKPGEFVTVTLGGHDDARAPRRVTYKVSQAEIARLAAGTLSEEQFHLKIMKTNR